MTTNPYMVIYPRGDRNLLFVSYVIDYEEKDYDLASRKRFETEEEAQKYARELSKEHNIPLSADVPKYLDE